MRPIFSFSSFYLVLFFSCGSIKLWEDTERVKKRKKQRPFFCGMGVTSCAVARVLFCICNSVDLWSVCSMKLPVKVPFLALVSTLFCVNQMIFVSDSHEDVVFTEW
ncbi:hypothetical protein BT93_C2387 [Corymbia citriodora subsp. variegata]|nr:hypothetical protein BT93_C2387 [Corymbia citriodora subsp. variegata]